MRGVLNQLNFKLVIELGLPSTGIFLAKDSLKVDRRNYLLLILC